MWHRRLAAPLFVLSFVGSTAGAQQPPCARPQPVVGAVPTPSWRLRLDRVTVDDQRESGGDRPYFITIVFRSRIACSHSTVVSVVEREPHDWVSKSEYQHGARLRRGDHMSPGESLAIPAWMGTVTWDAMPVVATNAAGVPLDLPWVFGAMVLAIDNNNTPPHEMRRLGEQVAANLQAVLQANVEPVSALRLARAGLPREAQDSLAIQLGRGLDDFERILQMTVGSAFQPDRVVGIQVFLWPAVQGLPRQDLAFPIRLSQPRSSIGVQIHQQAPAPFERTLQFEGSGARYTVSARLERVSVPVADTLTIRALQLGITTGDDNLRDDSDVQLLVEFRDPRTGNVMLAPFAVNRNARGQRYGLGSRQEWQKLERVEGRQWHVGDIRRVGVRFEQGGGGVGKDNWDMDAVRVAFQLAPSATAGAPTPALTGLLLQAQGRPLKRFTGTPRPNEWWSGVLPTFRP